jgi:GTPase Era involved in 16S rRNA processing
VLTASAASHVGDIDLTEQMLRRSDRGAPIDVKWIVDLQAQLRDWTKELRVSAARSGSSPTEAPYAVLEKLVGELRRTGRLATLAQKLDEERRGFDQPPLVAIMGEYSVGKSTFINAWLGKPLLPTGEGVTTGTITILRYGEQERMRAVFKDGRVAEREGLASVAEFVKETGTGNAAADLPRHVDVFLRADVLRAISIVDSPGLNAPFAGHKEITQGYLAQADAIVWLFNVENAGKSTEGAFLAQLAHHRRKAVAVVNQIDLVPKDEAAEVIADVRRDFASTFAHAIGVSAKRALDASLKGDAALRERSGFPQLEALLKEDLLKSARKIKEEAALQKAAEVLGELAIARQAYDQRTEKGASALRALRESMRRTLESSLTSARQKAATVFRAQLSEALKLAADAMAARSVGDDFAGEAAAEPIARAFVAQVDRSWDAFVASMHVSYDALQKQVLDGVGALESEDWSVSLRVALAERRAELASWRKDLLDDIHTVDGYLEGYLAADGLCWAHSSVTKGSRGDAAAVLPVFTQRFDFLYAKTVDATTRWGANVQLALSDSLARLERELRKTALDLRDDTYGSVERAAASLGIVAAMPSA